MRVVHFVAGLDRSEGGPSRSVPRLCKALRAAGVEVTLLFAREPQQLSVEAEAAVAAGVQLQRLQAGSIRRALATASVVHLHGIWSPQTHAVAKESLKSEKPLVISPRGMLEPWARSHRRWRKALAWRLFQQRDLERASLLHATSEQEAQNLAAIGLAKTVVIPNGADIPSCPAAFDDRRVILFLSRIQKKKGLLMLVDAAADVRSDLMAEGWSIVIAGPDAEGHKKEVLAAIRRRSMDAFFTMKDEVDGDAKATLLRSAHLFVLPSYSENFGLVVAEALAAGVPVITTTGTPWKELEEYRCGWWVRPEVGAIAGALREAMAMDRAQLQAMGLRGRGRIAAAYSWEAVAKRFESVYDELARGKIDT